MVWGAAGRVFSLQSEKDDHAGFNGVLTHENGQFLYKSKHASHAGAERFGDYVALGLAGSFVVANQWFCLLPLLVYSTRLPRQLLHLRYFTYHAELLPHTEQVVFHKTNLFGQIERHYVDISCLEKIDAAELDQELLWTINMFDDKMIFRDTWSREIFVFDRDGIWNKDTLEHPLLN